MENKKILPVLAIGIILILAIIIGGYFWLQNKNILKVDIPSQKACTEEAKLCSDGKTSVGRTGPNCEFAECPISKTDETAKWKLVKMIKSPDGDIANAEYDGLQTFNVVGARYGEWYGEDNKGWIISISKTSAEGLLISDLRDNTDYAIVNPSEDIINKIKIASEENPVVVEVDKISYGWEGLPQMHIKGIVNDISDWQTYRNEKVGFSVDYPSDWGPVTTEVFRNAISGKGEEFYAYFSNKNFIIESKTSDFKPWGEPNPYLGTDPFQYCKKVAVSMDDCKKIDKNITIFSYGEKTEETIELMRKAVINNLSNKYKGLTIFYRFPSYKKNISSMGDEEINKIIKEQISKFDKNTINTFDQILSTFKFIN